MNKKLKWLILGFFLYLIPSLIYAQNYNISFDASENQIILENPLFKRILKIYNQTNQFTTISYYSKIDGHEFILPSSSEFSIKVNGKTVDGYNCRCFRYTDHRIQENSDRKQLSVHMQGIEGTTTEDLGLTIYYEIYPDLAAVRKWIKIINTGNQEVMIESLVMEDLLLDPGDGAGSDIYKGYGREWTKPPYTGNTNDPAILVLGRNGGLILGNESPGMMKYTSILKTTNEYKLGLTPDTHDYPFRRYLEKDESFQSPEVFTILTGQENPEKTFEKHLGNYIRKYLGVKLFKRELPPIFMYNTWNPFRININEKLIRELADELENTGVEYMIIDDGWQDHNGDWNVNKDKFPGGLKPVTDYIREKGMKPGLWISLTIAEKESEAFKKFRHLAVRDKDGNPANLHGWSNNLDILTMEIASPWYDYIKGKMSHLVEEYDIRYFKIDLAMVKSAYIMEKERSGSYDTTSWFKGREESLFMAFEKTSQLYDELSEKYPDLIIDCTFEIWGDWHIIDYALVKHADVDWISNFEAAPPEGSRTVRKLAFHHGLTVPTSCMVIGNQKLEAENHQFSFLSNLASTPIMLGDPRELTDKDKAWYKHMAGWFENMNRKYEIFKYYQTSGVFNQPSQFNWDGFARFNTEKNGGIFVVFRNGQPDDTQTFLLPWCRKENFYEIIDAESEKSLGTYSGKVLNEQGIKITIAEVHEGKAFEIRPSEDP